jgi:DNA repair exonuclease SbcCD ATPase subunit
MPEYSLLMPPASADERVSAVKKCREQFSGSKAKYTALKYDFINLQEKGKGFYNSLPGKNNRTMENFQEKIAAFEKQVAELQNKIEMLETIPPPQNNEAHYLRELLAEKEKEIQELRVAVNDLKQTHTAESGQGTNSFLQEDQQQEINRLKNLVAEQAHLGDMLDETRQQVTFLQNQLEQRVKSNKMMEQKLAAVSEELTQSQFFFQEAGKKGKKKWKACKKI